jgi:hypothetical protein
MEPIATGIMHVGWNAYHEVGLPENSSNPLRILTVCVTKRENLNQQENGAIPGAAVVTDASLSIVRECSPLALFDVSSTASFSSRAVSADGSRGAPRWLHLLTYHQHECYIYPVYRPHQCEPLH